MGLQEDISSLMEVLKSKKDLRVRTKAVEALGKIRDVSVVEPLIHALTDENWDIRRRAAWALGNLGEPAVEPLIKALRDENWDVRRKAAWALGNIKDHTAIDPLIHALQDEYSDVREEAAWALGNIKALRAVEPLIHALTDEYPDVRWQAARSLAVLTDLNEESVTTKIHEYESKLEEQDRETLQKIKKVYVQELKKLQAKSS